MGDTAKDLMTLGRWRGMLWIISMILFFTAAIVGHYYSPYDKPLWAIWGVVGGLKIVSFTIKDKKIEVKEPKEEQNG